MKYLFAAAILCCSLDCSFGADPLARRPMLGAQVLPLSEQERVASAVKFEGGVLLGPVFPASNAEAAGLQAGDILIAIDGKVIDQPSKIGPTLKSIGSGKSVNFEYVRNDQKVSSTVTLAPAPRESADDFDVVYDAVKIDGHQRRVVFTKPKGEGKYPLFVLIGGLGCYSVDPLIGGMQSYKEILYAVTRAGFATMRVEFTGMGDSEGPPCSEMSFHDEVHGFVEALKQLDQFKFVDRDNVVLFGHSMGGIVAPCASNQVPVKGIIALATSAIDWTEYELINQRRQLLLSKTNSDSIDMACKEKLLAMHLLGEGKSTEEIASAHPELADDIQYPVHWSFVRDLINLNFGEQWMKCPAKTLFIYGTSDFITAANEHEYGRDIVNRYHPGNGEYVELDDFDHFMLKMADQQASFDNMNAGLPVKDFNKQIIPVVVEWSKKTAGMKTGGAAQELNIEEKR